MPTSLGVLGERNACLKIASGVSASLLAVDGRWSGRIYVSVDCDLEPYQNKLRLRPSELICFDMMLPFYALFYLICLLGSASAAILRLVPNFGDNPGRDRMYIYVPDTLADKPAIVVAVSTPLSRPLSIF